MTDCAHCFCQRDPLDRATRYCCRCHAKTVRGVAGLLWRVLGWT